MKKNNKYTERAKRVVAIVKGHHLNSVGFLGLCLVAFGIGMIFIPAGVIAGGIALLLMEWSVEENDT